MRLTRILIVFSIMLLAACDVFDRGGDTPSDTNNNSSAEATETSSAGESTESGDNADVTDDAAPPVEQANLTPTPEMPQTTTNDVGTLAIGYPEGWLARNRVGTILFSNIDPVPDIVPERLAAGQFFASLDAVPFDVSGSAGSEAAEYLERTANMSGGEFLQLGEIESLKLGNLEAAQATGTYTVGAARFDVLYIVVIQNDSFGLFTLFAPEGEGAQYIEDAQQALMTYAYMPVPQPTPEASEEATEKPEEATAEATP